jgi:protoporphyrinogen/coproporphyrinogen III oxidase
MSAEPDQRDEAAGQAEAADPKATRVLAPDRRRVQVGAPNGTSADSASARERQARRDQQRNGGQARHLVVIGAGITGLAAARAARRQGLRVTVLESGARPGGKLALGEVAGVRIDLGAESILARRTEGTGLAESLGLAEDLVHPATITAGIWSRGALRPLPAGQLMGVPGDLRALADSEILSAEGLARAQADEDLPPNPIEGDVSVGAFVSARMGREVSDRLVEPLLGGVYAGHAHRLSLQATIPQLAGLAAAGTSLSEGVRKQLAATAAARPAGPPAPVFAGLRGGVGRLAVELAAANEADGVGIRYGADVRTLERTAGAEAGPEPSPEAGSGTSGQAWRITLADGTALTADAVVLAVPAYAAARLLAPFAGLAATDLADIEYGSVAIVTLAVSRAELDARGPAGSGFLVPAVDGRAIKAATFSSAKWPWLDRSAGDLVLLRASLGRAGETAELDRDDAGLVDLVRADLADAVGLRAAPVGTHVQRWPGSLPQYNVGHLGRVARIRAALPAGAAVAGAAYDGVGIPACIASAHTAVSTLMDSWNERPI